MKKIIGVCLVTIALIAALCLFSQPVQAASSGTCGDNLTWTLDDEGTLTISGMGDMDNYTSSPYDYSDDERPWKYDVESIKSVIIEDGITSIGSYAFFQCTKLTNITIPDGVKVIGSFAFYECKSLTSITIPDSVTSIGVSAFYDCYNLTNITIPDNVIDIGQCAFDSCYNIEYNEYDNALYLGNAKNPYVVLMKAKKWDIESCSIQKGTRIIFDSAFSSCVNLTNITIPDGVTTIGDSAFDSCKRLADITIPDSVTSIGNAFKRCDNLVMNVYGTAEYLGNEQNPYVVLVDTTAYDIVDCEIHKDTIIVAGGAFEGCGKLKSITFPKGLISVGSSAFLYCDELSAVYITDIAAWCGISFADIISNPLYYAKNLYVNGGHITDLVIPEGVSRIGSAAFVRCNVSKITLADSVTIIGDCAFYDCRDLNSVEFGNRVTIIGSSAFYNCMKLTEISLPMGVTSIGANAFMSCTGLNSIAIPEGVTSIGEDAFSYCGSLTRITIPGSVTNIGVEHFSGTSIWHLLYLGTYDQWREISKGYWPDGKIHFQATGDEIIDLENKICRLCCEHLYDNILDTECNVCGQLRDMEEDPTQEPSDKPNGDSEEKPGDASKPNDEKEEPSGDSDSNEEEKTDNTTVIVAVAASVVAVTGGAAFFIIKKKRF